MRFLSKIVLALRRALHTSPHSVRHLISSFRRGRRGASPSAESHAFLQGDMKSRMSPSDDCILAVNRLCATSITRSQRSCCRATPLTNFYSIVKDQVMLAYSGRPTDSAGRTESSSSQNGTSIMSLCMRDILGQRRSFHAQQALQPCFTSADHVPL